MLKGKTILAIDDDSDVLNIISQSFTTEGVEVITANNGKEGLRRLYQHQPDLVILDIMMPDYDGWEVCHQIRLLSDVPILMLTSLNQEQDITRGLDIGADDFVSKPFSIAVLISRSRALLRRLALQPKNKNPVYSDDYLTIDLSQRKVLIQGEPIKLTPTEFKLLEYLASHPGRVLSFQQILENVWGWEYQDSIEYVHVYIAQLRRKIETDPRNSKYLITEHGVGYRFERHLLTNK